MTGRASLPGAGVVSTPLDGIGIYCTSQYTAVESPPYKEKKMGRSFVVVTVCGEDGEDRLTEDPFGRGSAGKAG